MIIKMLLLSTDFTFVIIKGIAISDGILNKTSTGKDRALLVLQTKKSWTDSITGEKKAIISEHQILARSPNVIAEILQVTKDQIVLIKGTIESYKTEKIPGEPKQYSYILANDIIVKQELNKQKSYNEHNFENDLYNAQNKKKDKNHGDLLDEDSHNSDFDIPL